MRRARGEKALTGVLYNGASHVGTRNDLTQSADARVGLDADEQTVLGAIGHFFNDGQTVVKRLYARNFISFSG